MLTAVTLRHHSQEREKAIAGPAVSTSPVQAEEPAGTLPEPVTTAVVRSTEQQQQQQQAPKQRPASKHAPIVKPSTASAKPRPSKRNKQQAFVDKLFRPLDRFTNNWSDASYIATLLAILLLAVGLLVFLVLMATRALQSGAGHAVTA